MKIAAREWFEFMEGMLSQEKGRKGRVKNDLKTANTALLGSQSKMDSSLQVDKHVSHFTGQTKQFILVPILLRITVRALTKHQMTSCKTCRNHVTKVTSLH